MRHFFSLFLGLFIFTNLIGQDTISTIYFGKKGITIKEKAKHVKYIIHSSDSIETEDLYLMEKNTLVARESYKNNEPVNKWIYYSPFGQLQRTFNYDFQLKYSSHLIDSILEINYLKLSNNFKDAKFSQGDFTSYVASKIMYPVRASEQNIKGKVVLRYLIDENGILKDFYIYKGVYPSLDKEFARVIREAPNWEPATINGSPIKVCYEIPIIFTLQ
jgi:hypothetical protein